MSYTDYEERISREQGNYIVAGSIDFKDILQKSPLKILDAEIQVCQKTTLFGWFVTPVEYLGMLDNRAVFYLGKGDSDLFNDGAEYFDVTYIFGNNHIGKSYKPGSFRDSFYSKGRWQ